MTNSSKLQTIIGAIEDLRQILINYIYLCLWEGYIWHGYKFCPDTMQIQNVWLGLYMPNPLFLSQYLVYITLETVEDAATWSAADSMTLFMLCVPFLWQKGIYLAQLNAWAAESVNVEINTSYSNTKKEGKKTLRISLLHLLSRLPFMPSKYLFNLINKLSTVKPRNQSHNFWLLTCVYFSISQKRSISCSKTTCTSCYSIEKITIDHRSRLLHQV